jgi:hypothetical protein
MNKPINLIVISFLAAVLSDVASARQECIKGLTKIDMCGKARELSDEIASQLPIRMSQNMTWESVMSSGTTIQAHIRFSYDKETLEEMLKTASLKLSEANQVLQKSASNLCEKGSSTEAFIGLGGDFNVVYSFVDGTHFTTISVDSCPGLTEATSSWKLAVETPIAASILILKVSVVMVIYEAFGR